MAHFAAGKPVLAECGGMMACCDEIHTLDGSRFTGFGLLPGVCSMRKRHQGIGLQRVDYGCGELRGHGFHHSSLETNIQPAFFCQRQDGSQGEAVYLTRGATLSYFHHYFPSNATATARAASSICAFTSSKSTGCLTPR